MPLKKKNLHFAILPLDDELLTESESMSDSSLAESEKMPDEIPTYLDDYKDKYKEDEEEMAKMRETILKNKMKEHCDIIINKMNEFIFNNGKNFDECKYNDEEMEFIASGGYGTVYLLKTGEIYKQSALFNKIIDEIEKKCKNDDIVKEQINDMFDIFINIPNTTDIINNIISKSPIYNHYVIPTETNLCICEKSMSYNLEGKIKKIPIYEYKMRKVEGINMYDLFEKEIISPLNLVGITIQLLYITLFLNVNGIYHNDIHRKNILITKNEEEKKEIVLEGLDFFSITINCDYFVTLIDFEISILSDKKIIPIDFIESFTVLTNYVDSHEEYNILHYDEITSLILKINDDFKSDGFRIFQIVNFNNLPIVNDDIYDIYRKIFEKLQNKYNSLLKIKSYHNKYLKYKYKYIQLKKTHNL